MLNLATMLPMKWGLRVTVIAFCIVVFGGCLPSPTVACGDGTVCGGGTSCVDAGKSDGAKFVCASAIQFDECKDLEQNAACLTVDGKPGTCISATKVCIKNICGDDILANTEQCDDGNTAGRDGCSRDCQSDETCGNGVVDGNQGEECDSGVPGLSGDGCSSGCFAEARQWIDRRAKVIPPLDNHRMVYDSKRKKVVLFGGIENQRFTDQTWEFDGEVWSNRTFPVAPGRRAGHQMVFDSVRGVTVLFGGDSGTELLNDTWEFDGLVWTKLEPVTSPTPRKGPAMAYDSTRRRIVLFGGSAGSTELDDTWVFDGATWTQLVTSGPTPRVNASLAFDTSRNRLVLVGGSKMVDVFDDTWELVDATWQQSAATLPDLGSHQLVYDSVNHAIVLVASPDIGTQTTVLTYQGTSWTARPLASAPLKRSEPATAFDTTDGTLIMFGGRVQRRLDSTIPVDDTWTWVVTDTTWVQGPLGTSERPQTGEGAFAFDSARGKAVVVGGIDSDSIPDEAASQTWEFDGRAWRAAPEFGSGVMSQAMTYDSQRQVLLLFGGTPTRDSYLSATGQLRSFNGLSWTNIPADPSPPPRAEHAMVYDLVNKKTILFGGVVNVASQTFENRADTWEFNQAGEWHEVGLTTRPSPRRKHAMAYDARRKRVVLFGGISSRPGERMSTLLNDTWEFDGTAWTQWQPLASVVPAARRSVAMTYDAQRGVIVLVSTDGINTNPDVWEFDGESWSQQFPLNPPAPANSFMLTFDTVTNTVLIVNGETPATESADLRSYTFASSHPAEQCVTDEDGDHDGLSACADPDCFGRCYPTCSATYSDCDRNVGPHCGDGTCNPTFEDYLLCPGDCQR